MSDVMVNNRGLIPFCLEIGVHRGAILALWKVICPKINKVFGISPMNGEGLPGLEGQDFTDDVVSLYDHFKLSDRGLGYPLIYKGYSTDVKALDWARSILPKSKINPGYDILYIDGSHVYEDVKSDIINYAPLVKKGGILVIDDACNDMHMPWGFFQGIEAVTDAVVETMPPKFNTEQWEFIFNFVHNRIYRRIK